MKQFSYIVILFFSIQVVGQDSSMVRAKFNYMEFNLTTLNYLTFVDLFHLNHPNQTYFPKSYYKNVYSFNSINTGIKLGHHKMTLGLVYNPTYVLDFNDRIYNYFYYVKMTKNKLNFNSNYFFYFSKYQKKVNHFLQLNFNTQTVKDYIDKQNNFEIKKGYAFGLGYGVTFYLKKHFLIEPSLLVSQMQFKNKDNFTQITFLTTTYTTEQFTSSIRYVGLGLKIGYIIPFKNK